MAMTAARLPWLCRGGSHADLESVSSHSLLHSIYGSQVSQVLLASDDNGPFLTDDHSAKDSSFSRRTRPKSSPAISGLEREKQRETNSHLASMPPQKRQLRARPATACVRGSQKVASAGRPTSALVRRASSSLFLEDVENASPARTINIYGTKPVTLTRVPEYVNFWQGKPLSIREHAIPVHTRKAWQRPKSDYGSRNLTHKISDKILATVMEGVDGSMKSTSGELTDTDFTRTGTGKVTSNSNGACGTSQNRSRGYEGDGLRRNGSEAIDGRWGLRGRDGVGSRTGASPATNMWAQRSKRSKTGKDCSSKSTDSCDDDDFFCKDQHMHSSWLEAGGHSTASTRFELPMDLVLLEQMSPLQYLKAHCIVSHHHTALCSKVFTKLDKDRDGHLSKQEIEVGLQEVLHGCLSQAQAQHLLALVHYPLEALSDLHLFASLCCLAERVFSIHLLPALAGKQVIECVDFEALEWKLRGCTIGQPLHNLFTLL